MQLDYTKAPEQVRRFVQALIDNAKSADEEWRKPDMAGGKCFAETIPYVSRESDGRIQVCDNYERLFGTVYTYYPPGVGDGECKCAENTEHASQPCLACQGGSSSEGRWTTRQMYSDEGDKPYTFDKCMADASIMFTG